MRIVDGSPESLDRAADVLRGGGVVAFPTETVYGLGANALDASAVARVFEIKQRPSFDPLIVHVLDEAMLGQVVMGLSPVAVSLAAEFWPGPLTLVVAKRAAIPDLVTSGLASVAVRMPAHPIARALLERVQFPLAAPSANPFGYLSSTRAEHVTSSLDDRVDLVIDGGPSPLGLESTIVALEPVPTLLRPGAIPISELEAVAGPLAISRRDAGQPRSPGRLPQHYAPRTPIRIVDFPDVPLEQRAEAGALAFRQAPQGYRIALALAPSGDLRQAAAKFFEFLHDLDAAKVERIDAEHLPERGLGAAMMDRLRRAAHLE
ncbi:MAG: threonylcarbamoyl-AMP synthase [Candidatus Eremiobacteraeota bacterium]|nr:threonylcarbamoyl-AMP synthase [Candidatus Eremiobacteraeota bacterium]